MQKRYSIITVIAWILFHSLATQAQHNSQAHTHGEANITVVFENKRLLIEVSSPAVNMLGFEHQPVDEKQWEAINALEKTLDQPSKLITISEKCILQRSKIQLPFKRDDNEKLHEHDHHHDHDHTHEKSRHSEIHMRYEWQCKKDDFPILTFNYFEDYMHFESLLVQWIVNNKQGINKLTKNDRVLDIGALHNQ